MRALWILLPLVLVLAACGSLSAEPDPDAPTDPDAPAPQDVAGRWEGAIAIAGQELGIIVNFRADGDTLTATIDIPQQGAADLPLGGIALAGDTIRFAIEGVGATFDGTVSGDTISGDFSQSGQTGTFSLTRAGEVLAPTPAPALPYRVEELTWALDDTTMTATLTLPEGDGPFPAVLFVAGSGPTDRNWTSPLLPGTNGSAALLADALTREGYATLRFDKRVTGPNAAANVGALAGTISLQSHLDEVNSALAQLTARPEVDASRVFGLGNSEGTLHVLNAQVNNPTPPFAGLILTAPPGRPLEAVLREQIENNVLAGNPDADRLLAEFNAALDAFIAGGSPEPGAGWPETMSMTLASLATPINLPFSRDLMTVDAADWLPQVAAPVLVLIGQKDIQVDWETDGAALQAVAGDNVTFEFPPNANHVLKLETKPAAELTAEDAAALNAPDRVLDPDAWSAIREWLAQR
jgi:alpha-beta hydrolase superfamily lysophospholipase